MIKKLARWILRDELSIIPPSKVMMHLKYIFCQENDNAEMSYALAMKIAKAYEEDYERCIATCQDIKNDLAELKTIKKQPKMPKMIFNQKKLKKEFNN